MLHELDATHIKMLEHERPNALKMRITRQPSRVVSTRKPKPSVYLPPWITEIDNSSSSSSSSNNINSDQHVIDHDDTIIPSLLSSTPRIPSSS